MNFRYSIGLIFLSQIAFASANQKHALDGDINLRPSRGTWLEVAERAAEGSECEITCTNPETGESATCSIACEEGHSANCYCYENTPTCTCY
jgi:hypothetical protein